MLRHPKTFPIDWKLLVSLAATPLFVATAWATIDANQVLLAQSTTAASSFPLPSTLPSGTSVKLDGSSSMAVMNDVLKSRFEEKFPGTTVRWAENGTTEALQALIQGDIDLAAVGRPLTAAEKAQNLTEVPISREKIAIIVGPENPFQGSLTSEQFAKIFRGEIRNWAQVGGPAGPIRLIDRPDASDTRQALSSYPVFQSAPFKTGATATQVPEDDTAAVVQQLGKDGIGYTIASQVLNQPNVRILPLHDTLPSDPRYPFSQPRGYVYKGQPNPGTQAFLGFATSAPGQEAVQQAKDQEAATVEQAGTASPQPAETAAPSAEPVPVPEVDSAQFADLSPLWWLLLPLLGMPLLGWLLKGRGAAVAPLAAVSTDRGRIVLTPRNCRDAYAYWEVPDVELEEARRQGGSKLKLRLYDVTDIPDMDQQTPHAMREFNCNLSDQDLHLPIAVDDRDYVAELGYVTESGRWLQLARSSHVRVPACTPVHQGSVQTATAAVGGAAVAAGAAGAARSLVSPPSHNQMTADPARIVMVPLNSKDAYVYWEVSEAQKTTLKQQGGHKLMLRVHDATNLDLDRQIARQVWEGECDESSQDKHIPIPQSDLAGDRNYVAELGYLTNDQRWLSLTRSAPVCVPALATTSNTVAPLGSLETAARAAATELAGDTNRFGALAPETAQPPSNRLGSVAESVSGLLGDATKVASNLMGDATKTVGAAIAGGAAAIGINPAVQAFLDRQQPGQSRDQLLGDNGQPEQAPDCRIILVPRSAEDAYAYWEVAEEYQQTLRERGGRKLMLRIHDVTNLDIDYQPPHTTLSYVCNELDQDKHVVIPTADRDYIAELGYFTDDDRWLRLIRSFHVRVPSNFEV